MIKLLACDIGFASTGLAIFAWNGGTWSLFDCKCTHTSKKRDRSVALDDIRRTEVMATEVINYYLDNQCSAIVAEIPTGGALSASAAKCMGAAVAMIATVRLTLACPVEWITPNESRKAAGWSKELLTGAETRQGKTKAIKQHVMARMCELYPALLALKLGDREHIADACATYLAARSRDVIIELIGALDGCEEIEKENLQ